MSSTTRHLPSNPLRLITHRLASTPAKRLPHIVPFLASTIAGCFDTFSASEGSEQTKSGSESGILVHKYKTQLSTLLQDKAFEARWSAVVLIKATIEVGGWAILQDCGVWVRGMLAILNKPDPPATKKLCIIALIRIVMLTQGHQSSMREITTPSLPAFLTSCLNIITLRQSSQELRYPNINSPLLAPTPSHQLLDTVEEKLHGSPSGPVVALAQRLYALLPICAPKNSSSEEWSKLTKDTIAQIHRTADYVFRAMVEDFSLSTRVPAAFTGHQRYEDIVSDNLEGPVEIPEWKGIEAGVERLVGLLQILQSLIVVEGNSPYTVPAGAILSTVERILSITIPSSSNQEKSGYQARLNPEIRRDEREGLWVGLSCIHVAAVSVLSASITRLESSSIGFGQIVLEQVLWVFQHDIHDCQLRRTVYEAVIPILELIGPSMSRLTSMSLSTLISEACNDVLGGSSRSLAISKSGPNGIETPLANKHPLTNADSYLKQGNPDTPSLTSLPANRKAAMGLLTSVLSNVPPEYMSIQMRSLMDRTALLAKDEQAILASVLNPQEPSKGKMPSSILPLFARVAPSSMVLEGVLRPRMPILQQTRRGQSSHDMDEDEVMSMRNADYTQQQIESETSIARNTVTDLDAQTATDNTIPEGATARPFDWRSDFMTSARSPKNIPAESFKRSRAADNSEIAGEEPIMGTEPSEPKRVRLTDDDKLENVELQQPEAVAAANLTPYATTSSIYITSLLQPDSTAGQLSTTYSEVGGANDSDDSFEIPPIIMDSDSDEEVESGSEEQH